MISTRRLVATTLVGGVAFLTLAACGSSAAGTADPGSPGGNASAGRSGGGGGDQRFPGVSGLIVAVSGTTLQVRTASGQSAVSSTAKTAVTEQRAATASDVTVGLCATVRSTATASGGASSGTASPGTAPAGPITAASVSLTEKVDGSCQGGFGGGRPAGMPSGVPGGGAPSDAPSGGPSGVAPAGAPGGAGRGFGGVSGAITAVHGSTVTIEEKRGTQTSTATVELSASTTYTRQAKVGSSAITTGKCVLATGKADSTGAVAATALRLSAPVNGECGFGGAGRRPGAGQSGG